MSQVIPTVVRDTACRENCVSHKLEQKKNEPTACYHHRIYYNQNHCIIRDIQTRNTVSSSEIFQPKQCIIIRGIPTKKLHYHYKYSNHMHCIIITDTLTKTIVSSSEIFQPWTLYHHHQKYSNQEHCIINRDNPTWNIVSSSLGMF
jgi:hypothetical protein